MCGSKHNVVVRPSATRGWLIHPNSLLHQLPHCIIQWIVKHHYLRWGGATHLPRGWWRYRSGAANCAQNTVHSNQSLDVGCSLPKVNQELSTSALSDAGRRYSLSIWRPLAVIISDCQNILWLILQRLRETPKHLPCDETGLALGLGVM